MYSVAQRKKEYFGLIRGGINFHVFKVCLEKFGNVFVSSLLLVQLNWIVPQPPDNVVQVRLKREIEVLRLVQWFWLFKTLDVVLGDKFTFSDNDTHNIQSFKFVITDFLHSIPQKIWMRVSFNRYRTRSKLRSLVLESTKIRLTNSLVLLAFYHCYHWFLNSIVCNVNAATCKSIPKEGANSTAPELGSLVHFQPKAQPPPLL